MKKSLFISFLLLTFFLTVKDVYSSEVVMIESEAPIFIDSSFSFEMPQYKQPKVKPSPGTYSPLIDAQPSLLAPPLMMGGMNMMSGENAQFIGSTNSFSFLEPQKKKVLPVLKEMDRALLSQKRSLPTERARFYYENKLAANESCHHCPEYLKLIGAVNDIVAKVEKPMEVGAGNEQIMQIDRLKFMYVERVSSLMNGEECGIIDGGQEAFREAPFERDHLSMLLEEVIDLPSITAIQIYPQPPQKEIRYLYRGEGLQSHLFIELSVKPDKSATVRYYQYEDPETPDHQERKRGSKHALLEERGDFDHVKTETTMQFAEQSLGATLSSDHKDWLVLRAKHRVEEEAGFTAMIPLHIKLPGKNKREVVASYSQEHSENLSLNNHRRTEEAKLSVINPEKGEVFNAHYYEGEDSKEFNVVGKMAKNINQKLQVKSAVSYAETESPYLKDSKNSAEIAIADQQGRHEFVHAKYEDGKQADTFYLKTKHRLVINPETGLNVQVAAAEQKIKTHFSEKEQSEFLLSLTNYRQEYVTLRVAEGDDLDRLLALSSRYTTEDKGSFQVAVDRYDSGANTVSVSHHIEKGKNRFSTVVGHDSERKTFASFNAQRSISSTATMLIDIKTDSLNKTTMMYQYQNKF